MAEVVAFESVWGESLEALGFSRQRVESPGPDGAAQPAEVRAAVVRNRTRVDATFLDHFPRLQVVGRAGVGLDNVDLAAADARGVVVVSPRGANAISVAEHTLGLTLALVRRTVQLDADVRRGGWDRAPGRELCGGTWGLLGAGSTGLASARLARAVGMSVLGHDPYADPTTLAAEGIVPVTLNELAERSTVVSCHLPATPETRGLLGREFFAATRPELLLVNVGRGEVIDEEALAEALAAGRVGGAALDVRANEPAGEGPFAGLPNVVLTPHVAGITTQSQRRIIEALADDIARVLSGRVARHAVGAVDAAHVGPV